jgi:hypothetical protein
MRSNQALCRKALLNSKMKNSGSIFDGSESGRGNTPSFQSLLNKRLAFLHHLPIKQITKYLKAMKR